MALVLLAGAGPTGADPVLQALEGEFDLVQALVLLEELLGSASEDGIDLVEVLLRDAAALRAQPLDINAASFSQLVRVPLIDAAGAAAIIARREAVGPIGSLEELEEIPWFPRETVSALRPYLLVVPGTRGKETASGEAVEGGRPGTVDTEGRGGIDAEDPGPVDSEGPGGIDAKRPGIEWSLRARASCRASEVGAADGDLAAAARTLLRLRVSGPRGLEFGIGCERDAEEASFLDHSAFFVSWGLNRNERAAGPSDRRRLSVVAGDFVGEWGQGIVFSRSRFPTVRGLPRRRDRLRGYDGASESGARRGLAVEASRGRARVTVVGARTRLDATIDERGRATTIRSSGYHRTDGERRGADALGESLIGGRVVAVFGGAEVGASFLHFGFDPPLASGDQERQRFRFEGSELDARAADVRLTVGPWRFGAEAASTSGGGRAALACAQVREGAATVHFGFGHLSRSYWSPLGGGIPGFSSGGNGIAGWIGAAYRIAPRERLWIDLTVGGRPWRSYSEELPEGFRSWSGGVELPFGRLGDLTVEMRERTRRCGRGDPPASVDEGSRRARVAFRASGDQPLSFFLERLSSSAEGVEEAATFAFGARGELELWRSASLAVGVTQVARDAGTRPIVQYEPTLPGEFGLRSLSESGARWYARVVAGLSPRYGLSLRIGGGPGRGRSEFGIAIDTRG